MLSMQEKAGQLSLQPCKHNMGLHLVSRSTRQTSDSLAVASDEHPAARVLIQGLLNLPEPFGPAKRSWHSPQHTHLPNTAGTASRGLEILQESSFSFSISYCQSGRRLEARRCTTCRMKEESV